MIITKDQVAGIKALIRSLQWVKLTKGNQLLADEFFTIRLVFSAIIYYYQHKLMYLIAAIHGHPGNSIFL